MIFDTIDNAGKYYRLSHGIRAGLEFLRTTDLVNIAVGRHEIVDGVYASIQEYTSKSLSEGKFEAHKKYIDIQYVIKGKELVGVADYADFEPLIEYDENKDIEFLTMKTTKAPEMVELREGQFLILYPDDAHMPSIAAKEPTFVKKAVVKVDFR